MGSYLVATFELASLSDSSVLKCGLSPVYSLDIFSSSGFTFASDFASSHCHIVGSCLQCRGTDL